MVGMPGFFTLTFGIRKDGGEGGARKFNIRNDDRRGREMMGNAALQVYWDREVQFAGLLRRRHTVLQYQTSHALEIPCD